MFETRNLYKNKLIRIIFFIIILSIWIISFGITAVFSNLGNISLSKGNLLTAEALFKLAEFSNKNYRNKNWGLGQTYFRLNKFPQSQDEFEHFIKLNHNRSALTHFFLGHVYSEIGMEAEAIQEWRLSESAYYFESTGHAFRSDENWINAAKSYNLAYQIDPERKMAYAWNKYSLGQLALANNDPKKAILYFQEVLEIDPDNYDAHLGLGSSWLRLNNLYEAENVFLSALELRKDSYWPLYYLGKINYQKGQCSDAINLLNDALKLNANHHTTHIWLARSYRKCGDIKSAINEYRRAVEMSPDDKQILRELEDLLK